MGIMPLASVQVADRDRVRSKFFLLDHHHIRGIYMDNLPEKNEQYGTKDYW